MHLFSIHLISHALVCVLALFYRANAHVLGRRAKQYTTTQIIGQDGNSLTPDPVQTHTTRHEASSTTIASVLTLESSTTLADSLTSSTVESTEATGETHSSTISVSDSSLALPQTTLATSVETTTSILTETTTDLDTVEHTVTVTETRPPSTETTTEVVTMNRSVETFVQTTTAFNVSTLTTVIDHYITVTVTDEDQLTAQNATTTTLAESGQTARSTDPASDSSGISFSSDIETFASSTATTGSITATNESSTQSTSNTMSITPTFQAPAAAVAAFSSISQHQSLSLGVNASGVGSTTSVSSDDQDTNNKLTTNGISSIPKPQSGIPSNTQALPPRNNPTHPTTSLQPLTCAAEACKAYFRPFLFNGKLTTIPTIPTIPTWQPANSPAIAPTVTSTNIVVQTVSPPPGTTTLHLVFLDCTGAAAGTVVRSPDGKCGICAGDGRAVEPRECVVGEV